MEYGRKESFFSDHRPVYAYFTVKTKKVDLAKKNTIKQMIIDSIKVAEGNTNRDIKSSIQVQENFIGEQTPQEQQSKEDEVLMSLVGQKSGEQLPIHDNYIQPHRQTEVPHKTQAVEDLLSFSPDKSQRAQSFNQPAQQQKEEVKDFFGNLDYN